ncbi:MAG: Hsp20/alpha crystallin family protein [Myxococcota bacterium]
MFWEDVSGQGRMWAPWQDLERLQDELNRVFTGLREPSAPSFPAVNIWTNQEGAVVRAEVPGIDATKIDISVMGNAVTINGRRDAAELKQGETYHRRERVCGLFTRTVEVPFRVDPKKVSAEYKRGVLSIMLPRAEEEMPKKINVRAS